MVCLNYVDHGKFFKLKAKTNVASANRLMTPM